MMTSIDDQAAAWFVKSRATSFDKQALDRWLDEDIHHRKAYADYAAFWQSTNAFTRDPELQKDYRKILNRPKMSFTRRILPLAASLLLLVGFMAYYVPTDLSYETVLGEQRLVSLSDGSTIKLNTETSLIVEMTEDARTIHLEKGQAFFEVAKDKNRPFTVFFDGGSVTALGTRFEVYKTGTSVQVTLMEGSVKVRGPEGQSILTSPTNSTSVPQISTTAHGLSDIQTKNPKEISAWQDRKLMFDNWPLEQALAEVNRYSSQKLLIGDKSLKHLHLSGVFQTSQPDLVIEMIRDYFSIRVVSDAQGNFVLYPAASPENT